MQTGQWLRLFWSALLHGDETHLLLNVSSFLWKVRCQHDALFRQLFSVPRQTVHATCVSQGAILEPQLGLVPYAALLLELLVLSHGMVLAVTRAVAAVAPSYSDMYYRCGLLLTLMPTHVHLDCECAMLWPLCKHMRSETTTRRDQESHPSCRCRLSQEQTSTEADARRQARAQGVRYRLLCGTFCPQGRPQRTVAHVQLRLRSVCANQGAPALVTTAASTIVASEHPFVALCAVCRLLH